MPDALPKDPTLRVAQMTVDAERGFYIDPDEVLWLIAERARLAASRDAATDADESPGEIAIANYDEWRAFQAWKRDAATTGEPVQPRAWGVDGPGGLTAFTRVADAVHKMDYYNRGTNSDPYVLVPLYSRPDPQVAALTEERDAMQRRAESAESDWQRAEDACQEKERIITDVRASWVSAENDFKREREKVAALTASLEAAKRDAAWWEAELRDTLRAVTAECNIPGINAITSLALELRRKAGRPDRAALPSGDAPRRGVSDVDLQVQIELESRSRERTARTDALLARLDLDTGDAPR